MLKKWFNRLIVSALIIFALISWYGALSPEKQSEAIKQKGQDSFGSLYEKKTSQEVGINNYYQFEEEINLAAVKANNQEGLQEGLKTLSKNIKQEKYSEIILWQAAKKDQQKLLALAEELFQGKKISLISQKGAADDLAGRMSRNKLLIWLEEIKNSENQLLKEANQWQLASIWENFSTNKVNNFVWQDQELVEAFAKIAENRGDLKALPTLKSREGQVFFEVHYLTAGKNLGNEKISLRFFGDMMFDRNVEALMNKYGENYPFLLLEESLLGAVDYTIVNLEGPIAEKEIKTSKAIAFRFKPAIADLLKRWKIDAASLANNHSLDMGKNGLNDSYKLPNQVGIKPFGLPNELTKDKILFIEENGFKIAIIGLDDVDFKYDKQKAIDYIKELKSLGYLVIPYIHWDIEYQAVPSKGNQEIAKKMIEAGAMAVIGHHPHVVQAMEMYQGKPIFYSLGNAVFDQYFSKETQEGLTLTLLIDGKNAEILLIPYNIPRSQMKLKNSQENAEFLERLAKYSSKLKIDSETKEAIIKGKIKFKIAD